MPEAPPIVPADPSAAPATPAAPSWQTAVMDGEGVPEKFKGKPVAELFKSYTALEKVKAPVAPAAKPNGQPSIAPIEAPAPDDDADMAAIVDRAGLKPEALAEQWKAGGKLTDEQYGALKKVGVTRGMANEYLSMVSETAGARQWAVDRAVTEAEGVAGGKTQLETLRQWAASSIPQDRLARLNSQLQKDPAFYPDYIRLVAQEHQKAVGAGSAKPLIGGSAGVVTSGIPSTAKDFSALTAAAAQGDESAIAQLRSLPSDQYQAAATRLMNS